ncbi:type II toxin-antitoxin system VapC family toxin, partial [Thermodesulfovibrionales bacterium]|nr:type II toxin-antitoxin system VapC family toxin [Thermodesulfovibrionales bacterium]
MKYYFDTSSLVKIYHSEQGSKEALELYQGDREICISELGVLEFVSAIYRKYRESEIDSNTLDELILKFQEDVENRYELLSFSPLVFEEASRLLEIHGKWHSLRTLDSLQFAFFSTYCEKTDVFVCSDKRLASVVELEGNTAYMPQGHVVEKVDGVAAVETGPTRIFISPPHMGGEE